MTHNFTAIYGEPGDQNSIRSPEVVVRASREAGEGAVAMTTGEEGFNLREAELSAHLAGHERSGGVLSTQEWRS